MKYVATLLFAILLFAAVDGRAETATAVRLPASQSDLLTELRVLPDLEIPTLMIHAANDPWIPAKSYRAVDWDSNARLTPLLASGGGHVGFHRKGTPPNWHDLCMGAFFGALAG